MSSGLHLVDTIRGHKKRIFKIAYSPNGRSLASSGADNTIRIWDLKARKLRQVIEGHPSYVVNLEWSPDGRTLASSSSSYSVRLWDVDTGRSRRVLEGHTGSIRSIAWSMDGRVIASSAGDSEITIWDFETGKPRRSLDGRASYVSGIAWSPGGGILAAGADNTLQLWDLHTGKLRRTLDGHASYTSCIAWSPDGRIVASGSHDATLRIWDPVTGRLKATLEGHTSPIGCIAFSSDSRLLSSKSLDGRVRLWHGETWETVAMIADQAETAPFHDIGFHKGMAFHPKAPAVATLDDEEGAIRIWDLDVAALLSAAPSNAVHYANAKVVLLGDSGVGKSGLALTLIGQPFTLTESTHGRHVWTFEGREAQLPNGRWRTQEILLWDLAGQPGYRLIHQLHLNEVAVALVLFDARSETDPFAGVRHWDRALRQAQSIQRDGQPPIRKLLVAARTDRGGIGASADRILALAVDLGFDDYFETSSKEGRGVPELIDAIRGAIDWDSLPSVSSTVLFREIRKFLTEEKDEGRLLSTLGDLYRTFMSARRSGPRTEDLRAEFETCIGRAEARGLIRRLNFGHLVLLQPEKLDSYASALVNAAKEEPDGLGCILEEDARAGRFRMPEAERLTDREQEKLLLIATVEDLLRHEIALREASDGGTHLVFPSQLTREILDLPDPEGETIVFTFQGPVLSIYATLAVRLSHSGVFSKEEIWKNAITYRTKSGGAYGMYLRELAEGHGELTLFFGPTASDEVSAQFEEYVRAHLNRRAIPESVTSRALFACSECGTPVTDLQVRKRRERGFDWIACNVCEARVPLVDRDRAAGRSATVLPMDRAADIQRDLDAGLVSAAGEMRSHDFAAWAGSSRTTLALVFSDMVDSTPTENELGNEEMGEVRRAYFRRTRELIERQEGYEVRTVGDSFMVAFRTAADALDFALALQADTGHPRVAVRAGMHVGVVNIEEGDAYGRMVNLAARIQGMAAGGEIWTSDRARSDVMEERSRAHQGVRWVDHPECELKGFPERFTLWSVSSSREPTAGSASA